MANKDMKKMINQRDNCFTLTCELQRLSASIFVGILENFKTTMITMLKALMEKIDNMHEQNRNFSKEMEIRKNEMEMLEIKSPVIGLPWWRSG